MRAVRITLLFFILPVAAILLVGGLLAYLFQGQEVNSETISARVHNALQAVAGDNFEISIGGTGLSFISSSLVSLKGTAIGISNRGEKEPFVIFDQIEVGLDPLSILSGNPKFNRLVAKGGKLLAGKLGSSTGAPVGVDLPAQLQKIGLALFNAEKAMADGSIKVMRLENFVIETRHLKRKVVSPIVLNNVVLRPDGSDDPASQPSRITLSGNANTGVSEISFTAGWNGTGEGKRQLSLGMGPVSSLEWFDSVANAAIATPGSPKIGMESDLRIDVRLPFDSNLIPGNPVVKIQAERGELRMTPNVLATIGFAIINLQIDPASRTVTVDNSRINLNGEEFSINGRIAPAQPISASSGGDMEISAVAALEQKTGEASSGLGLVTRIEGSFQPATSTVQLDKVVFDSPKGSIIGKLNATFGKGSPAIDANFSSAGFTVAALKRIWPLPIAVLPRRWIMENLDSGEFSDLSIAARIPAGRIAEVDAGANFKKGEFLLNAKFKNAIVRTFGEMPPLALASGDLQLDNTSLSVNVTSAFVPSQKPADPLQISKTGVDLSDGRLEIPDVYSLDPRATATLVLEGPLQSMANIANAKPLQVADKIAIKPADMSGKSKVGVSVTFPIIGHDLNGKLDWAADIALKDAASKSKLFDHSFENADLALKVDPKKVSGTGKATIDGLDAAIEFTEPLLAGAAKLRQRKITTAISHQDLAKLGVAVSPVVTGNMQVEIFSENGKPDRYTIDLTDTAVSLPWIYWDKSRKIPAKAVFSLSQKDGVNTLSDFEFSGKTPGGRKFGAKGELSFTPKGLLSANMNSITLNEGDLFDVNVKTGSGRYTIEAKGRSFDARAMIQQVIHTGKFSSDRSATDVTLNANFGQLFGFNDQVMENTIVSYRTDNGLLSSLQIKGAANGQLAIINAARTDQVTRFVFDSKDAGASLSFVNLYDKMRGGKLSAALERNGTGPFAGDVKIRKFIVENEERLASIVRAPVTERRLQRVAGQLQEIDIRSAKFDEMSADIIKDSSSLGVENGRISNSQIGLTFEGKLYDAQNQMSLRGTFMPLFTISRVLGEIPIIGDILSNGKNSGLIGITYRLKGAANNPAIAVNPVSVIAPGIFRDIFKFQE
jgi:hypothetical protein